jgi:hypothetical protein
MATPECLQIKESMKLAFLFRQISDSKEAAQRSGQISGQLGASASSPNKKAPMPRDSDARDPQPLMHGNPGKTAKQP